MAQKLSIHIMDLNTRMMNMRRLRFRITRHKETLLSHQPDAALASPGTTHMMIGKLLPLIHMQETRLILPRLRIKYRIRNLQIESSRIPLPNLCELPTRHHKPIMAQLMHLTRSFLESLKVSLPRLLLRRIHDNSLRPLFI